MESPFQTWWHVLNTIQRQRGYAECGFSWSYNLYEAGMSPDAAADFTLVERTKTKRLAENRTENRLLSY